MEQVPLSAGDITQTLELMIWRETRKVLLRLTEHIRW
jgi:hypothetical protein